MTPLSARSSQCVHFSHVFLCNTESFSWYLLTNAFPEGILTFLPLLFLQSRPNRVQVPTTTLGYYLVPSGPQAWVSTSVCWSPHWSALCPTVEPSKESPWCAGVVAAEQPGVLVLPHPGAHHHSHLWCCGQGGQDHHQNLRDRQNKATVENFLSIYYSPLCFEILSNSGLFYELHQRIYF